MRRERALTAIMLAGLVSFVLLLASAVVAEANGPVPQQSASEPVTLGDDGDSVKLVQQALVDFGYTLDVDGEFGPRTARAVVHFQKASGLLPDGIVGPVTEKALGLARARQAGAQPKAPQSTPQPQLVPATTFSGPCAQYAGMLSYFDPGWSVSQFQQLMYRESRCQPGAVNPSGASGLLQIMPLHIPNLGPCGVYTKADLLDAGKNICSAAIVYRRAGNSASPWAL